MSPFDRPYTTFYWSDILNIALSCTFLSYLTLNNVVTLKSGTTKPIITIFLQEVVPRVWSHDSRQITHSHGIRQCCKGDDASYAETQNFSPATPKPRKRVIKKLAEVITLWTPKLVQKFVTIRLGGFVSAHARLCAPKVFTRLVFLFFRF